MTERDALGKFSRRNKGIKESIAKIGTGIDIMKAVNRGVAILAELIRSVKE
jgi:hypothetical protein